MKKFQAVLTLGIIACVAYSSSSLLVDDVRADVIKELHSAWIKLERMDREGKSMGELFAALAHLLKGIPEIITRVERELSVYEYEDALKSLSKVHNTTDEWKNKWSEIAILTSPVDVLYGHFKLFPEMPETFVPGAKIMDFDANTIVDLILKPLYNTDEKGTITLPYLVEHVHTMVTSRREINTFAVLNDFVDDALEKSNYCLWNGKTQQRIIYGFYVSLLSLDIKEYTLKNFAWMISNIVNKTEIKPELDEALLVLETRASEKLEAARKPMSEASPAFWRCDPSKFVEGENYEQFKELLQGYIENEVRMHPSGSCKQSCGDFAYTKAKCNENVEENCFKKRICTGTLINCEYIAADSTVCLADPPRRFDYIQYKKGPHLGSDTCNGVTERRDSYWRLFYHCSNCFCLCDDPRSPTTVRHVSLVPVTSDVSSNKIVTGFRFIMHDGILHINIEEGIPEKNGFILDGSTEWKAIPRLNKKRPSEVATLDYTNRAFDLDDIVVPPDFVITGIRFRRLGSHINIEVQATQISPVNGELLQGSSHWLSNDNTPETHDLPRKELVLTNPNVPTLTKSPSIPDSVHDQFVNFGASSRSADVSQTTVPFIDTQEVRPNPPVWLKGVGVYHRGQPNYGGFIAPRVFTWSAADFIYTQSANP
ncbi:unnamed protein product [Allacma fusca]|uniref:Uncharacterized protein n=1 Tax=Allacma fusca TaxID=39272 RepID=A0A8J2PGE3_9HEXA|nr:unnamed protein product [Allacma fusca]